MPYSKAMEIASKKEYPKDIRWTKWGKWLSQHTEFAKPEKHENNKDFESIGKSYIITLPKREKHVRDICRRLKRNINIFRAIDKKKLNIENLKNSTQTGIVAEKFANKIDNEGVIACALSHLACIWDGLITNQKKILIFEDDLDSFNISEKTSNWIDSSEKWVENFVLNHTNESTKNQRGICNFYGYCWELKSCQSKNIKILQEKNLTSMCRPLCAHAYTLDRKAMLYVLNKTLPLSVPYDSILCTGIFHRNLISFGPISSEPKLIKQNRDEFGTTIGNFDGLPVVHDFRIRQSIPVWNETDIDINGEKRKVYALSSEVTEAENNDTAIIFVATLVSVILLIIIAFIFKILLNKAGKKRKGKMVKYKRSRKTV